jgi:hypothetical protein
VCNIRPSVHSAYRHFDLQASVVALYGKLQHLEPTTSQGLVRYIAGEAEAVISTMGGANPICANLSGVSHTLLIPRA